METSNRTVLVVYDSLPYSEVVEFCHCIKMDLAAPRSMEEAQEIDRRGELKYDYFTNYVRIRFGFHKTRIKCFIFYVIIVQTLIK